MGFQMDAYYLSHLVWCGNIYLFASESLHLQTMVSELTAALHRWCLSWKPSSLLWMAAGSDAEVSTTLTAFELPYKRVEAMEILGVMFDQSGRTTQSVEHRLVIAERCYFVHRRSLRANAGVVERIKAWAAAPQASASFRL